MRLPASFRASREVRVDEFIVGIAAAIVEHHGYPIAIGGNSDRGAPADLDAKVAIAQCQENNSGPAIPVLEQKLHDAKVAVPPRGP